MIIGCVRGVVITIDKLVDDSSAVQFISMNSSNDCNSWAGCRAMEDLNGYHGTLAHWVVADFEGGLKSIARGNSFSAEIEILGPTHMLMQGVFASKFTHQGVESKHNPLRTVGN